jgi:hypothetical protein
MQSPFPYVILTDGSRDEFFIQTPGVARQTSARMHVVKTSLTFLFQRLVRVLAEF